MQADTFNPIPSFREARAAFADGYWRSVLRSARGCVVEAARLSGQSRSSTYWWIDKLGLDVEAFR